MCFFTTVSSAFNHWRLQEARNEASLEAEVVNGLVSEELFPNYVLAVHSSRDVFVEQIPMTSFCLADVLLLLASSKGKRHEVFYTLSRISFNPYKFSFCVSIHFLQK